MQPVKHSAQQTSRFTLHRTGQFAVNVFGPTHCGIKDAIMIKYDLRVTCTADSLDARGFLFDQMAVDHYFKAQSYSSLSCEQMVVYYGRELYKLIVSENRGCKITRFILNLSPEPHAADMTFEYGDTFFAL